MPTSTKSKEPGFDVIDRLEEKCRGEDQSDRLSKIEETLGELSKKIKLLNKARGRTEPKSALEQHVEACKLRLAALLDFDVSAIKRGIGEMLGELQSALWMAENAPKMEMKVGFQDGDSQGIDQVWVGKDKDPTSGCPTPIIVLEAKAPEANLNPNECSTYGRGCHQMDRRWVMHNAMKLNDPLRTCIRNGIEKGRPKVCGMVIAGKTPFTKDDYDRNEKKLRLTPTKAGAPTAKITPLNKITPLKKELGNEQVIGYVPG